MSRYSAVIVDLEKKSHNRCFGDFARAVADVLRQLGHDFFPRSAGRQIVFGSDVSTKLAPDAIIYNAEQLSAAEDPRKLLADLAPSRVIWDYSESNIERLKALGYESTVHCPVGYIPSMTSIKPKTEDIDVLFYGWVNDRRGDILKLLDKAGLKTLCLFDTYGTERDEYIARSKIVLNLHFHENSTFEIFRCSHLFANRKCVVTEEGNGDRNLEELARQTCAYVPREEIVDMCLALVADKGARQAQAEQGFAEFSKIDLVENVRRALEESSGR